MNKLLNKIRSKLPLRENVTYKVIGANGKAKQIFQPNKLFQILLKLGLVTPFTPKLRVFGHWSDQMMITNIVTKAGKAGTASRINGAGGEAAFTYIAVGTGTTTATADDTALETEITDSGLARAAATASRVTTDDTNDTAQLQYTFSVTGTKAVTESGVFNASSGGVMLARQTFSAINVVNGDSLQITWKIDVD